LAQPFGADSVVLTVFTSGDLRAGGTMSFTAEGVKLTHPARPLETAALVANSLTDGQPYEATLTLRFGGSGRGDLAPQLRQLEEIAIDVAVTCEFGPPGGAGA